MLLYASLAASTFGAQRLRLHTTPVVEKMKAVGRLDAAQRLHLAISLPLRDQAGLTEYLRELSDSTSPNYRKYLTPAQFSQRYGPSAEDYAAVIAYTKAHRLNVTGQSSNRVILDVEGAVSDIEKALHVTMRTYRHPREPRQFYAPDTDAVPDLAVPILGISGLDNYELPQPLYKINPSAHAAPWQATANPNSGSSPNGGYMGNDFRTAYAPGVTLTGSGQTVGLLQFDGYTPSDITYYENETGRSNVPLTNVLLDGFSGAPTGNGGEVEVSLDIEMVISMAPGVSGIMVYEAGPSGSWHDILNRMASDDLASQISCSWYIPNGASDPVADQIFQQMAAQGQSFYAASGDSDAYTGLIPFPGDTPYITQVGGTTLTTAGAGGAYTSETVWNWGTGQGSGGGISTQYAIPTWQQGISMTANLGSITMRNTPDVAMTADNVYVRADGADRNVGGTSCAAPLWAGFTALINQQALINGWKPVGFINPAVYSLAQSAGSYAAAFNDIVTGNNFSTSSPTKFPAEPGYDLCTGLGTPTGMGLITAMATPPIPIISTPSLLANGAVGVPYSVSFAASGGFAPYTWAVSGGNLPAGLNLSSAGLLSGTPTATGTFGFTVQVTGSNSASTTGTFAMTVYQQGTPIITTGSPLPNGMAGAPYSETFSATGGALPYSWAIVSGTAPAGLGLSSNGVLSGNPTATGTFNFTVQVTGSDGLASATAFTLVVPPAPVITSALAATATNGAAFSYQITASNSPASYFATGLPTGLSVNASTGLISGTPSGTGVTDATISAINTGGTGSATLAITVAQMAAPVIGWSFSTVGTFNSTNGAHPIAQPTKGSDGNIYGTTVTGGAGYGSIYKLITGGTLTTLANFTYSNGANPYGILVQGTNGNFYGTCSSGGVGYGNVFETSTSGVVTSLVSFNSSGYGFRPLAGLALAADGNYYGTDTEGFISGAIYRMTPAGLLSLAAYMIPPIGSYPTDALIQGGDGYLYGTAEEGGSYNDGAIFKTSTTGQLSALASFNGLDGQEPIASLAQDGAGNFYGATYYGGAVNEGTIFKVNSSGNLTTLYSFSGPDGANPVGGLVMGGDGNFYGTTSSGGTAGDGTIFMITQSGSLTTLHNFTGGDGSDTQAGMTRGDDNYFYGTTYNGGSNGDGTVFSLAPFNVLATVGQPFSYTIQATSIARPLYHAAGLPAGITLNPFTGVLSGTPTTTGSTNITISATNPGGTGSAELTVVVGSAIPAITSPLNVTGYLGSPFDYQIAATHGPTSYSANGLPSGWNINSTTGVITGTPSTTGTVNILLLAANGSGIAEANLQVVIVPPPPVITSAATLAATIGNAVSYQITATSSPTSYAATGLPAGLSINTSTGLISGVATTAGVSDVVISAIGATGTGSTTLIVTITPPPPVITSGLSATGTTGDAFSYQITATNNPSSYSASGLPAGLSINTSTGLISGTPTATGSSSVTIGASNSGGSASATLMINIFSIPAITSGTYAAGFTGLPFTYQIVATSSPTSYGAAGLPAGLSLNPSNGIISGTPTATGTSAATITASNAVGTGSATLFFAIGDTNLSYLAFSTIGNPQIVNSAFSVSIAAYDSENLVIPTYSGTLYLSGSAASGTVPVTPSVTSGFVNGVWTGNVTVGALASNVVLTATDSAGDLATSNSFNVTTGPLDHYAISAITSPQQIHQSFTVTVTAQDAGNNTVTSYTGSASITCSSGSSHAMLPVSPATTGAFTAGVWTGNVTINQTGTGAVLNLSDGSGGTTVYVADSYNSTIRAVTTAGVVTTVAGVPLVLGSSDGTGSAALFSHPYVVATDGTGAIYVGDSGNDTVRKITAGGVVTTLAGTPGVTGTTDGTGSTALFNDIAGITVDASGNIYVADTNNDTIRMITPGGVVTTIGGSPGITGTQGGVGNAARFNQPYGVVVAPSGTLYVDDHTNERIAMGVPNGGQYTWSNLAGDPGVIGSADGTGTSAQFDYPEGIAITPSGTLYVVSNNNTVRTVSPAGVVTTVAGVAGNNGSADGTGSTARFNQPWGVALDGSNNAYIVDSANGTVRKVTPAGVVTTIAGTALTYGTANGAGGAAQFHFPNGDASYIAAGHTGSSNPFNINGNLNFASFVVSTIASPQIANASFGVTVTAYDENNNVYTGYSGPLYLSANGASGSIPVSPTVISGFVNGVWTGNISVGGVGSNVVLTATDSFGNTATSNSFNVITGPLDHFSWTSVASPQMPNVPFTVTIAAQDAANNTVTTYTGTASITCSSGTSKTMLSVSPASTGAFTAGVWTGNLTIGQTGTGAILRASDGSGVTTIYVADSYNSTIRAVTTAGMVTTVAGVPLVLGSTDGTGSAALFSHPYVIATDGTGAMYVGDSGNDTVRKITAGGVVTTLAGTPGVTGTTDGTGSSALFNDICGITVDTSGNIYVADTNNDTIRRITPGGVVSTIGGSPGVTGTQGGVGSAARFNQPYGIVVAPSGTLYVDDHTNERISMGVPNGGQYTWSNLAGDPGVSGSADGTGTSAQFYYPEGITITPSGTLYVVSNNNTVRTITSAGVVTTLAGVANAYGSTDGTGSAARFNQPWGVALDGSNNAYIVDSANGTVRKVTPAGVVTTIAGTALTYGTANGTGGAAQFHFPNGDASYIGGGGHTGISNAFNINGPTSYAAWQNLWFTTAQLNNPAISGETATPAGDGIPNLLKYAFNLNPMAIGQGSLPVGGIATTGSGNYLTLTYLQTISATDLTFTPEVSTDLQTWNSGPSYIGTISVTPNSDNATETVIVEDLAPVGGTPQFIHLRVTGP